METNRCPLCEAPLEGGSLCPSCGWDTTADGELYPTLFSAAGTLSRAAREAGYRARAAEAEREALYLRFGRTVFAGQSTADLESCAREEDPARAVRRLASLLGVALTPAPAEPEPRPQAAPLPQAVAPAPTPNKPRRKGTNILLPSALLPSAADKKRIQAVRFQDSLRGLTLDHWDVSEARNGSLLACLREEFGLLTLLICGEEGVYAPEDCSGLFLDYKNLRNVDFGSCFHTENSADLSAMFSGCQSLQGLDLSGLDVSGARDMRAMFSGCASLARVQLPRGITAVYAHMFDHCARLKELQIPQGVVGIGDYAFYACAGLETLSLPESVIGIGRYTFRDCAALKQVNLSRRLRHINSGAFWNCAALTELVIPATVTRIETRAFRGCAALKTVYFTGSPDQWKSAVEKPNDELEKIMIQFSI